MSLKNGCKEWLFLNNYETLEQAQNSQQQHYNCWLGHYPKVEYRIESVKAMFTTHYLLYVNLHENS